jgi:hypothetical protein
VDQQEIDATMQLNQRDIEAGFQEDQRDVDETLRIGRRDAPAWQTDQRNADAGQRNAGATNETCQLRQINQRNTVVMLRTIQHDITTILDSMEIDFESLSVKLRDNRFITRSEIRRMLYSSENTGKLSNEKQYLVSRLYTAISA